VRGICFSSPNDDEEGGLHSTIRSERSERSNPGSCAVVLDERASRHAFRLRASEEGSG
jgi:hypothetical protein